MPRLATSLALAAVLAALAAPPSLAAGNACQAAVSEHLERMKIDTGDVRTISVSARTRSRRGGNRVIGIDAWVSLESCRGSLVMRMSRSCRLKEVYSRGECRFPDVPHH
jgi:hypothetical protein